MEKKERVLEGLGARLRRARGKRTLEEVGKDLGVNKNSVNRYENEKQLPDADYLARFAEYTGFDVGWLITGSGSPLGEREDWLYQIAFRASRYTDEGAWPAAMETVPHYITRAYSLALKHGDLQYGLTYLENIKDAWESGAIYKRPEGSES